MQTCDGNTVTYGGYTNAWDERGWTWEKTYTNEFCEVTDDPEATPSPTSEPYVPPPDPTFPYDPCDDEDSTLKQRANQECEEARQRANDCCDRIGAVFCDDLMENCAWDSCFAAEGDEDAIFELVAAIVTEPIDDECDELVVDEENYEEHQTMSPTKSPTESPTLATPEPTTPRPTTPSPTMKPTHICPIKQEKMCCCPSCEHHSVTDDMLFRCERDGCAFDGNDDEACSIAAPAFRHCTAKCAKTASPTAEPTKSPTPEPTTSKPSVSPTTAEPTPRCPASGTDSIGDSCAFVGKCNYDFVECCGERHPTTICTCEDGSFECMIVDRCMGDYPCPTPQPTEDGGNGGWGNPKPEPSKQPRTPRPKPSKEPRPTRGAKTPRPIKEKTPRPTKAKPVKTPRPTANKVKTARPTKAKPVKTPRPTTQKTSKTPRPTKDRSTYLQPTPKPTVGSGWGAEQPSKDILENENAEMMAVDLNGSTAETFSGYSSQTEIVGLLSIATVFAICGYSMMCKQQKEDSYTLIEDPVNL